MIKVPSRVPILPWESPLRSKESAPSLCSTSGSTGLNSYSAGTKQETPRPIASNPPPDSTSATTTKATTKNNIRTHPHPGLRPLPNKQKQRPSRPTDKTNRPTPRLLPRMLGFPIFPLFRFGLTHRYEGRGSSRRHKAASEPQGLRREVQADGVGGCDFAPAHGLKQPAVWSDPVQPPSSPSLGNRRYPGGGYSLEARCSQGLTVKSHSQGLQLGLPQLGSRSSGVNSQSHGLQTLTAWAAEPHGRAPRRSPGRPPPQSAAPHKATAGDP